MKMIVVCKKNKLIVTIKKNNTEMANCDCATLENIK